jgi:hypothetical protein
MRNIFDAYEMTRAEKIKFGYQKLNRMQKVLDEDIDCYNILTYTFLNMENVHLLPPLIF